MFLVAGFILSPQAVTNLRATSIGLNDRDTPSPIVLGRILRLAVPLLRKCRLLIGFDASVLFVETFVADPDRDALALFGWDRQIGEVVKIATGDLVRTITSRSDGDFLEDCWCLGLIDITAENFELRASRHRRWTFTSASTSVTIADAGPACCSTTWGWPRIGKAKTWRTSC